MFILKKKNYLKRSKFIDLADSNKIWSKSMTIPEIKELLDLLEKALSKYDFDIDNNFVVDGRRKNLKSSVEAILSKTDENITMNILDALFIFWEFVNNEYYTITSEATQRLNITKEEMDAMCMKYTESGIICLQEKDIILEMIQLIKNRTNEI